MNRRSFIQSVTAALAYMFLPPGLRKSAPVPPAEVPPPPTTPEPPVAYEVTLPLDMERMRWAEMPAAGEFRKGQYVFARRDGYVTPAPEDMSQVVGVVLDPVPRDGMIRVALSGHATCPVSL